MISLLLLEKIDFLRKEIFIHASKKAEDSRRIIIEQFNILEFHKQMFSKLS